MIARALLAACLLLAWTSVARAEPISAAIGLTSLISALIGGASIGIFGVTVTAAAIGGAIVSAALAVGLSLAQSAFAPRGSASASAGQYATPLNTPEIRYNERQAIPSKRVIYGEAQVGGAIFFEEVKSPYLTMGFLICDHRINRFKAIWIGEQKLTFSSFAVNTLLTPVNIVGQPDFAGNVKVCVRDGSTTQTADALILNDYPNVGSGFRQLGIGTAVLRYSFGANQEQMTALYGQVQRPSPFFLVEGKEVFDPRDPSQSVDDPTTWKYCRTAALIQADYLISEFGGRIPISRMDYDEVIISANWDDSRVSCKDGTTIPRYTIDGVVKLNQPPVEVMRGMLTANRGMILEQGGKVWVSSSYPRDPIVTITDDMLAGAVDFTGSKPKREDINRLRSRFVAFERNYQTVDGPTYSRTDLRDLDGEVLDATLDLPFTTDHRRVQRLQKAFLQTSRLGKKLGIVVDVKVLALAKGKLVGKAIRFQSDLFPDANDIYLVSNLGFADTFTAIELSCIQYDKEIESDFDPNEDEQDFELADVDVS